MRCPHRASRACGRTGDGQAEAQARAKDTGADGGADKWPGESHTVLLTELRAGTSGGPGAGQVARAIQ
jgi:hypothetical protein